MTLETLSDLISILTPFILLLWFYYSQRQALAKSYYSEIDGVYAGYCDPVKLGKKDGTSAGFIMNIRDTDDKGFFKGNFDYREVENFSDGQYHTAVDSVNTFIGKLEFELFRDKTRHPFYPEQNRVYKGRMYVVTRLDFDFEKNYTIDHYLKAEYEIAHYREMQTVVFTKQKVYGDQSLQLPNTFTLFKRHGVTFEPYQNLKDTVFRDESFSDR